MEKLIHRKDAELCYHDEGVNEGLPVVLIHGFPLTSESWNAQVEALQNTFRVIRYDVSGLGKSLSGDGIFTIDGHADDLIAILDDTNIPKAVVAGLSMGGYIALRAYEKYPDRFSGIILANTKAAADNNESKIKRAAQVTSLKENGIEPFASAFSRALLSEKFRTDNPSRLEEMIALISRQPVKGVAGNLVALAARTDSTSMLDKIEVPALIIHAMDDAIMKKEDAEIMNNSIRNSILVNIPSAGHLSNIEQPELFNKALVDFLKSIS